MSKNAKTKRRRPKTQNSAQLFYRDAQSEDHARLRAAAKWVLDLLRNVIVVALLVGLARRSNSGAMWATAAAASLALFVYLVSYIQEWLFVPLPQSFVRSRASYLFGLLLAIGFFFVAFQAITTAGFQIVTEIVKLQATNP